MAAMPPTGGTDKEPQPKEISRSKTVKTAAKATGASPRSVERAERIKKVSPATFDEVKSGKKTLRKAEQGLPAKQREAKTREDALARIEKTLGPGNDFLSSTQGKGPQGLRATRTLVEFSKLDKELMEKVLQLMLLGFSLKKAINFEARKKIGRNSTVVDLIMKAVGSGLKFKYETTDRDIVGWTVEIYRTN
jgi:hypothetical protein